jgi:hypothetical protein
MIKYRLLKPIYSETIIRFVFRLVLLPFLPTIGVELVSDNYEESRIEAIRFNEDTGETILIADPDERVMDSARYGDGSLKVGDVIKEYLQGGWREFDLESF